MADRGTPSWLGDHNAGLALSMMLELGPLSRNGISAATGFSKQTAAQIVARLDERGLIEGVGEESIGRGPNATTYSVRRDIVYGVAVNVDQDGVRSTVVDVYDGDMPVAEVSASGMGAGRSATRDVAQAVLGACNLAGVSLSAVRRVCVGVPSSVDPRADELSSVEALPGWSRSRIRHQIEQALRCTVEVDNDVNLAAIAERRSGAFDPGASLALIWLGYGIGLAVDIAGNVLHGAAGGAGEIGRIPVSLAAVDDAEGTDLESLVGAASIERLAEQLGEAMPSFEQLRAGVAIPHRVLEALAPRVALGVIPVLGVLDPDTVVFGGPIGRAGGPMLAELTRDAIRRRTRWSPTILVSGVQGDPVLRGARATLAESLRGELIGRAGSTTTAEFHSRIIAADLRGIH